MKALRPLSVVVITRNEGAELRRTVENLEATLPEGGEVVVVDDGSSDGSADHLAKRRGRVRLKRAKNLGVARARNLGARVSLGKVVVFADAHIRTPNLWWRPLVEILENPAVGGAAPAIADLKSGSPAGYGLRLTGPDLNAKFLSKAPAGPVAVPILPGCCLAMRREVFEETGGWDEGMLQRGGVDNEGCVRFWLFGYDLVLAPEVVVRHRFRERSPYPVGWPQYLHNRLRLAFAHLSSERLGKVVVALGGFEHLGEALELVVNGNVAAHRRAMMDRRVRSDDWYFEKFGMNW